LAEKWEFAARAGYDGIELRGRGSLDFERRLPELREALRDGVPMPSVCVEMLHFFGDFDAERRRDAIVQLKSQLSVLAALGGGVVGTPASYGMFSRRLPPFEPPRSPSEDRAVLLEGLAELGEHAAREGVVLVLEPLNRYEDHMVNTLEQAVDLLDTVGLSSLKVMADTYHMNIEEDEPTSALIKAAAHLGHVQVSDSNRLQPGAGHIDWAALIGTLDAIGYAGQLAVECRLRGEPAAAAAAIPGFLRRHGA
jgi:sugar phosphate isomerase/epimerase